MLIREESKTEDDVHILSTTFMKPKDEDQSWVFCSTLDAYLSYKVIWGNVICHLVDVLSTYSLLMFVWLSFSLNCDRCPVLLQAWLWVRQ